jgi:hypothetical protein
MEQDPSNIFEQFSHLRIQPDIGGHVRRVHALWLSRGSRASSGLNVRQYMNQSPIVKRDQYESLTAAQIHYEFSFHGPLDDFCHHTGRDFFEIPLEIGQRIAGSSSRA